MSCRASGRLRRQSRRCRFRFRQLRKLLDEGALETRPTGYLLRVEPGALDLQRFQSLLDQGRERLAAG